MGVRVVTSTWDSEAKGDVLRDHVYLQADSWTLQPYGGSSSGGVIVFLEIVDSENDRMVALFDTFDHVEVIEDSEEE